MNRYQDQREGFAAFLLRARAGNIPDNGLYAAIESVPRAEFVPSEFADAAWSSRSIPIACGEVIEGIDIQAKTIAALEIVTGHRVLEVGTGSGYTAAVMGRLGAKIKSVDRYKTLVKDAAERCRTLELGNVLVRQADGLKDMASEGPFDRIVVWAAFEALPRNFADLLASGGVMIAPIGPPEGVQDLARLVKIGSRFEREDIGTVRVQPLVPGIAAAI